LLLRIRLLGLAAAWQHESHEERDGQRRRLGAEVGFEVHDVRL
jgi:hypothetical protein